MIPEEPIKQGTNKICMYGIIETRFLLKWYANKSVYICSQASMQGILTVVSERANVRTCTCMYMGYVQFAA